MLGQHRPDLEALKAQIDTLSPGSCSICVSYCRISFVAATADRQPTDDLDQRKATTGSSTSALLCRIHHGTTTEPLGLIGFEIVFCNACGLRWMEVRETGISNAPVRGSRDPAP